MANGNNPQGGKPSKLGSGPPVWRSNLRSTEPVDWGRVDTDTLRCAVDTVTRAGAAIMLGLTSDGGAYSICVLSGTSKVKEYPHTPDECKEVLESLTDWFSNMIIKA